MPDERYNGLIIGFDWRECLTVMTWPVAFSHPWYLLGWLLLAPIVWLWWLGRHPFRRWRDGISLTLRIAILLLLVSSIAGMQWVRASDELAVVFLLDVSDSIDAQARQQAVDFVRAALAEMSPDDRAALVLFGADALVERPLSQAQELGNLLSIPATGHTDIGEAVRLGLALLPATAQRRLVLLSDGVGNVPGAEVAAQLAAAGGVELDAVSLPVRGGDEASIDALEVPSVLYEGEQFSVVVRVQSRVAQRALLRLYADQTLIIEQDVLLDAGLNSFLFDLNATEAGFSTFTAHLLPEKDVFYQNNVLGAFSMVRGAPRVLVVARAEYREEEGGPIVDEGEALVRALGSVGLQVERLTPPYMPADLASLGEYATVVLVNVPATALSPRQMALLQSYVRDLGRGLVCIGGEDSYGVGGYFKTPLEETLPIEMTIKDKERMPPLAIVFVIDKSGSMDMAASTGAPRKIDLAKEAVIRSLELLNDGDQVGVIGFEESAKWVWPLAPLADIGAVQKQVMTMRGGGGTNIHAGLAAAVKALQGSDARLKHVIVLTDGGASQEGLTELAMRLRAMDGTLSTVGIGQDAAAFLRQLALDGGGRYHYTDNPSTIPQIFAQETMLAQRAYIVEETFYPALSGHSPILDGIEAVPALYGYVAASPKPAAQVVLVSNQQDPLLAQWQYGLGRAVAWTSDAKGKWAKSWVGWEQFPRFWAQAVRWTIVDRQEGDLETQINDDGEQARIVVDVVGEQGEYGNALEMEADLISPSLERVQVVLRQTAPGRYEGVFSPEQEGVYLVRVAGTRAGETALTQITGFVRTYSPEYRVYAAGASGADEALLRRLTEAGHGDLLTDPARVFRHDNKVVRTFTDVWPWLLSVAVCLLPLDIGVRRVTVDWGDLRRAWRKARGRLRRPAAERAPAEPRLSRLMAAKSAARAEVDAEAEARPAIEPLSAAPVAPTAAEAAQVAAQVAAKVAPEAVTPPAGDALESMTSRLLAAKRRARDKGERER